MKKLLELQLALAKADDFIEFCNEQIFKITLGLPEDKWQFSSDPLVNAASLDLINFYQRQIKDMESYRYGLEKEYYKKSLDI